MRSASTVLTKFGPAVKKKKKKSKKKKNQRSFPYLVWSHLEAQLEDRYPFVFLDHHLQTKIDRETEHFLLPLGQPQYCLHTILVLQTCCLALCEVSQAKTEENTQILVTSRE